MSRRRAEWRSSHENKGALVAGLASLCVGCGSLLKTDLPPSTSYVLAPAPAASTGVTQSEADLSIGRPDLAPGLDTERIAVLKGRQLDYYRGAQWGGRTTEVVQTLLVDSFEDQQLFPQRHAGAVARRQRVCARHQRARFPGGVRQRQRCTDRARDDSSDG